MFNDLPPELQPEELDRNAYNAAFYDLGLRWHWDKETYGALLLHSSNPKERLHHYLRSCHPHLLRAYEPDFLACAIQERVAQRRQCTAHPFDWAQAVGCELGV